MLKIRPLNGDSTSDDDSHIIRKETQEENILTKYNKSLKLQCAQDYNEAKDLLFQLLDHDIPEIENNGGLPQTMSTLKYSCFLNIGSIYSKLKNYEQGFHYYQKACSLDKSDVTLWFRIGNLALNLNKFKYAAFAFSEGLKRNKKHWPLLNKLIILLYLLHDDVSCLYYIKHALKLDSNYIRGHIIRKRLLLLNPGLESYYQFFDNNNVNEFKVDLTKVEDKELDEEINELSKKILAYDEKLRPKKLPSLTFKKPEELSWLSVGQFLIHIHKHLSDNQLSYLSWLDLIEHENNEVQEIILEDEIKNNVDASINLNDNECIMEIVEMESDAVSECLEVPSDDTETDVEKDDKNNTANESGIENFTDQPLSNSKINDEINDSDLKMDIDTTDKNESKTELTNDEKVKNKASNRRRRNSLSFLQPWAWHSKRKSSRKMGKNDKDDTIEGELRRIISSDILPDGLKYDKVKQNDIAQDDSANTMDIYNMYVRDENHSSSPTSPIIIDESKLYFGTEEEKEDVRKFWHQIKNSCIIFTLLKNFVKTLSTKWETKWVADLKSVFIDVYEIYRKFCDHPKIFSNETNDEDLKFDALITLLYSEFIFDIIQHNIAKHLSLKNIKQLSSASLNIMEFVCVNKTLLGEQFMKIVLRLNWLKAHIYMTQNQNTLAIKALNKILYYINQLQNKEDFYFYLPHWDYNSLITKQRTEKLLLSLETILKLGIVEELYENKNYKEVVKVLKESYDLKNEFKIKVKVDKPVQIVMLLHALWLTDREECFLWTEICLNEALPMYFKTYAQPDSFEHKRWSLVVIKCMVLMEACIKEENIIILDILKNNQTRLVENLTSILCHQLNSKSMECNASMPLETVKPWILLHLILQREEHRIQAKRNVRHCKNSDDSDVEENTTVVTKSDSEEDDEQEIPSSIQILFSAHELLGKKGWCLLNNGELLLFLVEVTIYRINAPIFEKIREKIDIHLEQAFFCLFQHPSKKNKVSRHLADHNVDPLPLNWEYAQQLYEFYQPKAIPEFDSYRYNSISNEMEQLLQRILALVPPEYDPQTMVHKVNDFINGNNSNMPESIDFPYKVSVIYYLLGDYYFKLHDSVKAQKYFYLDLCINPTRLDTWADLALGMASQLETKLNHCEAFKNECDFLEKVKSAEICFNQALKISNGHAMLWIEFGNFLYMAHSFCSRLLKGDTDMFSMEKFETLESQKEALLDTASNCFTAANISWQCADPGEPDERWLHHYMLGKIAEKKKKDPSVYLDHYTKAAKLLYENKATYPLKINYTNPQHLSMEALEINYRIHASVLKYLELHEGKPISKSTGKVFEKYLKESDNGLFIQKVSQNVSKVSLKRPSEEEINIINKKQKTDYHNDIVNTVESIVTQVTQENELKDNELFNKAIPQNSSATDLTKYPRIRVKNTEEIIDDMLKQYADNNGEITTGVDKESETLKPSIDNIPKQVEIASSPSRRGSTTSTVATTTTTSTSDSSDSSSSEDSDTSSSDSESSETESSKQSNVSKNTENNPMTTEEIKKLIDMCLLNLEQCISRFPQNYKALYRLTHFYLNNKTYRNLDKCRQLLLTEYCCQDNSIVTGLFSERRNSNFFNGIWRIPTSEIDRPGSFAAHMSRCIQILMQILRETNDIKMLLDLCLVLKRTPDPDKIYIRDSERQQLSDQALSLCLQSIRCKLKKLASSKTALDENEMDSDLNIKFILDVYKCYQLVQKNLPNKESVFSGLLTDTYKYIGAKITDNNVVLDSAIKFCQQRKSLNRFLNTQGTSPMSITKTPPTPQTTSQIPNSNVYQTPVQPLKKTAKGVPGRPRGRPPNINKHLMNMKKPTKDSNSFSYSNPYAVPNLMYPSLLGTNFDPKLALNLMMTKYQEEILKQYAQLSQSNLLSNPYAMNSLFNANSNLLQNSSSAQEKPTTSTMKPTEPQLTPTEKKDSSKPKKAMRYPKESASNYFVDPKQNYSDISLFKDRPGISITPINQNLPVLQMSSLKPTVAKTLQQKLAERQKQNPAAQQKSPIRKTSTKFDIDLEVYKRYKTYNSTSQFIKPNAPIPPSLPPPPSTSMMGLQGPSSSNYGFGANIPSSLTIMKAQTDKKTSRLNSRDSGISISQIPFQPSGSMFNAVDSNKIMNFKKPNTNLPKSKMPSEKEIGSSITPTNVLDNEEKYVGKNNTRVEIITIE